MTMASRHRIPLCRIHQFILSHVPQKEARARWLATAPCLVALVLGGIQARDTREVKIMASGITFDLQTPRQTITKPRGENAGQLDLWGKNSV